MRISPGPRTGCCPPRTLLRSSSTAAASSSDRRAARSADGRTCRPGGRTWLTRSHVRQDRSNAPPNSAWHGPRQQPAQRQPAPGAIEDARRAHGVEPAPPESDVAELVRRPRVAEVGERAARLHDDPVRGRQDAEAATALVGTLPAGLVAVDLRPPGSPDDSELVRAPTTLAVAEDPDAVVGHVAWVAVWSRWSAGPSLRGSWVVPRGREDAAEASIDGGASVMRTVYPVGVTVVAAGGGSAGGSGGPGRTRPFDPSGIST